MTFQPIVPLTGYVGWRFLQNTLERQQETFNQSSQVQRDTTYFRENIGKIQTAEELVNDRRLLSVALGAYGLDEDINNLISGNYFLTITDDSGCEEEFSFEVSSSSNLEIMSSLIENPCQGDSIGEINLEIEGGTAPYTYLWSDGQTASNATGLTAGTYQITVTDENGCKNINVAIVEEPADIIITSNVLDSASCFGRIPHAIILSFQE